MTADWKGGWLSGRMHVLGDARQPLLDFFTLVETIWSEMWADPLPKNAKSTLPIDVFA